MTRSTVVAQARSIVMDCFHDELSSVLRRQGRPHRHIDAEILQLYARARLDAERFSPRLERD